MTGIGTARAKKSVLALGLLTSADLQFGSVTTMTEHVDVLIVGAGLSGIGAAYHLQQKKAALFYLHQFHSCLRHL